METIFYVCLIVGMFVFVGFIVGFGVLEAEISKKNCKIRNLIKDNIKTSQDLYLCQKELMVEREKTWALKEKLRKFDD